MAPVRVRPTEKQSLLMLAAYAHPMALAAIEGARLALRETRRRVTRPRASEADQHVCQTASRATVAGTGRIARRRSVDRRGHSRHRPRVLAHREELHAPHRRERRRRAKVSPHRPRHDRIRAPLRVRCQAGCATKCPQRDRRCRHDRRPACHRLVEDSISVVRKPTRRRLSPQRAHVGRVPTFRPG